MKGEILSLDTICFSCALFAFKVSVGWLAQKHPCGLLLASAYFLFPCCLSNDFSLSLFL